MINLKEVEKDAQNNGEDIIAVNQYFVLSKDKLSLHLRGQYGADLTFDYNENSFLVNQIDNQYLELIWEENNTDAILEEPRGYNSTYKISKRFIFDFENETFYFSESDDRYVFYNSVNKIELFNFYLQRIDYFLGWISLSTKESKIITRRIITLNDDTNYEIYSYDGANGFIMNIIYNEGNVIKFIAVSDNINNTLIYSIDNVKKWYRLTREEGYYKLFYNFCIVETIESKILINLKTLKFSTISFHKIFPTTLDFNRSYYINKHMAKNLINMHWQYICVDNKIYDEKLNVIVEIKPRFNGEISLLDTIGRYVAVLEKHTNDHEIHIFLVYSIHGNFGSVDTRYICFYDKSKKSTALKVDIYSLLPTPYRNQKDDSLISFAPNTYKFIIDTQRIEEDEQDRRERDYGIEDHYSIWDALEGDPEAYWNID